MLRSLRLRLLVFLLLPLLVSGAIAASVAVDAFKAYEVGRSKAQLTRQAQPFAQIFAKRYKAAFTQPDRPVEIGAQLKGLTDARIFFVPNPSANFPGVGASLETLPGARLDWARIKRGQTQTFEVTLPGQRERSAAVASGIFITIDLKADPTGAQPAVGAIVLTRPIDTLAATRGALVRRVAPAFAIGVAVAAALALLLGFAITRPLRRLALAAGRISQGSYDVALDRSRKDEIGKLNRAFGEMADRLRESAEHERLFLMRVSHELRTPLTAIQGHVGALADGVIETEADRQAAFGVIADEATRLERLIRDLLDLAKLEGERFTLQTEQVDLAALLERCYQARREVARAGGVELERHVDDAPTVVGDGDRILQIITNLVENALRWTPAGGIVRLSAVTLARSVRIEVADSGPGVPVARREEVFRPFFSEDGQGTGLGLAIAAELAAAMGGAVSVHDAPEGGALFACDLPRAAAVGARRVPTLA